VVDFPRPAGISTVTVDKKTGKLPYADDADTMEEVFLVGTEPTELAEQPAPDAGTANEVDAGTTKTAAFDASAPSSLKPSDAGPIVRAP
jgi:penicillin-binding protein 1A